MEQHVEGRNAVVKSMIRCICLMTLSNSIHVPVSRAMYHEYGYEYVLRPFDQGTFKRFPKISSEITDYGRIR